MEYIFIRTRKLTMRQIEAVGKWLDEHATGPVTIRGLSHKTFIKKYLEQNEGNRPIHQLKVAFFNEMDSRHFLMEWG